MNEEVVEIGSSDALAVALKRRIDELEKEVERLRAADRSVGQDRFMAMINASPLAVVVLDLDGVVELWNEAARRMFGWSSEEVIGRFFPAVPPDRLEEFNLNLATVVRGAGLACSDTQRQRKDGTRLDARLWAAPLIGPNGAIRGAIWMISDITAQKKLDEDLRVAQDALKIAMKAGKMGYWKCDLLDGSVEWSAEFESLVGFSQGAFGGDRQSFLNCVHPEYREQVEGEIQRSAVEGCDFDVEFRFLRVDGSMGWMELRGKTTLDESGCAVRIDGFGIDITERKNAEAQLRDSEQRYRLFAEAMPVIAWSLSADGELDFLNQRYIDYSGYDVNLSPADAWAKVVHPDDKLVAFPTYREAVAKQERWACEMRMRSREGVYRWHLSQLQPVFGSDGKIIRWFGTATDIHAQKVAEEELDSRVKERTKELTAAIAELEGFTYTVSHDLRSPLRAINSSSSILLEELAPQLSEDHKDLLLRQAHNSSRLGLLIDELLKLSRLNRETLHIAPFSLTNLALEVIEELQSRNIADRVEFEVSPDLTGIGDPNLVKFVLLNLIENACKFSPNGGVVRICEKDGAFAVVDQGVGFDMRFAHKLFLPFERLVTESEFPGTGIGLANVARIVQRHGGKVWAESTPGVGSSFFFTLTAGR